MLAPVEFWDLIDHFLEVLQEETGFPVLIYDTSGRIIRATDSARIGDRHAGAEKIMRGEAEEYAVSPAEALVNPLVREGYSCPIYLDGRIVAGFGITGRLELSKPLAKIAAKTIQAWIKESNVRQRLAASEKKYRDIFNGSINGMFQSSLDGRFVTANPAMAKILGYSNPDELISRVKDSGEAVWLEISSRQDFIHRLDRFGRVSGYLSRMRRLDGQLIDVRVNARKVVSPSGEWQYIEGQLEDVTRERQAQEAIRQSEDKYAKAFNNSPVWVVLSSLEDGRYLEVNESFLRTLGYRREEVLGRTSSELGTWADLTQRERILQELKNEGRVREIEVHRRDKSGRSLTMLYWGEVLELDRQHCLLSVSMDITERKNWETALAASEEHFRKLFDQAPVLYLLTDNRDGSAYIRDANITFLESLGYTFDEVVGRPVTDFCSRVEEFGLFSGYGYQRALSGNFDPCECVLRNRLGDELYTLLHSLPDNSRSGQSGGTISMFLDVTARRRAEQEAAELEKALIQAQKMEAIGTLAGGIAHDFNNILSVIIGYSQLCLRDPAVQPLQGKLDQILQAGLRARELVGQILSYSRQQKLEYIPLQLGPLIKETVKMLRAAIPRTIRIELFVDSGIDNVLADPTQVQQVIMNLCTNAVQAMEETGGLLTLSLRQVSANSCPSQPKGAEGDFVLMEIADSGCGINPKDHKRIFEPYFTTKAAGKGTGLGLSVVQGIMQAHGGSIHVRSELGKGTVFTMCFATVKAQGQEKNLEVTLSAGGSERILLVDDEPAVLEVGRQMISLLGYAAHSCSDGHEALELLAAGRSGIDLVISDVTMPGLTGQQLLEKIRHLYPDLPVILCSGFSSQLDGTRAVSLGAAAFLIKPLLMEELAAAIRKALDEPSTAGDNQEGVSGDLGDT